jgi:hypothetical protein
LTHNGHHGRASTGAISETGAFYRMNFKQLRAAENRPAVTNARKIEARQVFVPTIALAQTLDVHAIILEGRLKIVSFEADSLAIRTARTVAHSGHLASVAG